MIKCHDSNVVRMKLSEHRRIVTGSEEQRPGWPDIPEVGNEIVKGVGENSKLTHTVEDEERGSVNLLSAQRHADRVACWCI